MTIQAKTTNVRTTLNSIALKELGLETLATQMSDDLDFHDLNVTSILSALEAAYAAGKKSSSK